MRYEYVIVNDAYSGLTAPNLIQYLNAGWVIERAIPIREAIHYIIVLHDPDTTADQTSAANEEDDSSIKSHFRKEVM